MGFHVVTKNGIPFESLGAQSVNQTIFEKIRRLIKQQESWHQEKDYLPDDDTCTVRNALISYCS